MSSAPESMVQIVISCGRGIGLPSAFVIVQFSAMISRKVAAVRKVDAGGRQVYVVLVVSKQIENRIAIAR